MAEGQTIYVVTSGEYSDYGIDGMYSTLEKATEAAGRIRGRVEWYALDDSDDAYGPWAVEIQKNGDGAHAERAQEPEAPSVIIRGRKSMVLTVMVRTEAQAIKVANERRAFLIASGIWSDEGAELITVTEAMFAGVRLEQDE